MKHQKLKLTAIFISSLFTIQPALAAEITEKDWTYWNTPNKYGVYPMNTLAKEHSMALGFWCDADTSNFQMIDTREDVKPIFAAGEEYKFRVQVDANPLIQIRAVGAKDGTSVYWQDTTNDELFAQQLTLGRNLKLEYISDENTQYLNFSLMGYTASITRVSNYCETAKTAEAEQGFTQPTTKTEYDKMVDEGFVTSNDSGFSY